VGKIFPSSQNRPPELAVHLGFDFGAKAVGHANEEREAAGDEVQVEEGPVAEACLAERVEVCRGHRGWLERELGRVGTYGLVEGGEARLAVILGELVGEGAVIGFVGETRRVVHRSVVAVADLRHDCGDHLSLRA
jgi:hypothetical protein